MRAQAMGNKVGVPRLLRSNGLSLAMFGFAAVIILGLSLVLSIRLRERGSPESQPVHAPHVATGS